MAANARVLTSPWPHFAHTLRDRVRSESNKSAYTSSVIAALAWPSIRWTTFGLAPALIAKEAAVCRSACAVTLGNVGIRFLATGNRAG